MKALVTGGSGFIGQHVLRKLVSRGFQVNALVRTPAQASTVQALGAAPFLGDILVAASLPPAMLGVDVIFHLAGWYRIGARDQRMAYPVNVTGFRNVLQTACDSGIPRFIYTSSIGIYGDTHGLLHDETYQRLADQPFITEYDRTKWLAYHEVVRPSITRGVPITVVIPGVAYGPGDPSLIGDLMRLFVRRRLFVLPGPETMHCYAHVEDVAEGIVLAYEKGKIGDGYILAGAALELWQVTSLWAALLHRSAPRFAIPARWLHPLAGLAWVLARLLPMPALLSSDGARLVGASYIASAEKARRELGWQARPVDIGFHQSLAWFLQHS